MTENLDVFFSDCAVPVVWNATDFSGILDAPDEVIANGMVITADQTVIVKSSDIGGMKTNDSITVNGSSMTVKYFRKLDDGALSKIWVKA